MGLEFRLCYLKRGPRAWGMGPARRAPERGERGGGATRRVVFPMMIPRLFTDDLTTPRSAGSKATRHFAEKPRVLGSGIWRPRRGSECRRRDGGDLVWGEKCDAESMTGRSFHCVGKSQAPPHSTITRVESMRSCRAHTRGRDRGRLLACQDGPVAEAPLTPSGGGPPGRPWGLDVILAH